MTTCDEQDTGAGARAAALAALAALPLHPWTDLRPTTGMLLGADDFEVLMGNPRAKHQLHQAWLHGSGVVRGLGVRRRGEWDLEVSPGLAVDGHGRELHLDAPRCLSVRGLLEADHDPTCGTRDVELCLVLRFDACLDREVEALVDPCDVTRQTTDHSRVVERVRLEVVRSHPPEPAPTYHRVRVLLGLDAVGGGTGRPDEPGEHARRCREEVAGAPSVERARVLLRHLTCLASLDAADWRPAPLDGLNGGLTGGPDCASDLFPVDDVEAGVLLACLRLSVRDESGCPVIVDPVELDTCRPTLLPTGVIQELLCGLAPGLLGEAESGTSCGPQLERDLDWGQDADGRVVLRLTATADLVPGSVRRAVRVSSLSETAWIAEDLEGAPRYDAATRAVVVTFADRPKNPILRILVRGTGAMPVYGADPVAPLAGVRGEDPGHDGHGRDAVLSVPNPFADGSESS